MFSEIIFKALIIKDIRIGIHEKVFQNKFPT